MVDLEALLAGILSRTWCDDGLRWIYDDREKSEDAFMLGGWRQAIVDGKRSRGAGERRLCQERMESRFCLTANLVISEIGAV